LKIRFVISPLREIVQVNRSEVCKTKGESMLCNQSY